MKKLSVLCVSLSTTATFARGGGVGSHMSVAGGAFGTSPAPPGTNSLGAALSSSGLGHPMKGPLPGTNLAIDREGSEGRKNDVVDLPRLLKRPCGLVTRRPSGAAATLGEPQRCWRLSASCGL